MITIHKQIKYAFFFALGFFLFNSTANAMTSSGFTPQEITNQDTVFSLNVQGNAEFNECLLFASNGRNLTGFLCGNATDPFNYDIEITMGLNGQIIDWWDTNVVPYGTIYAVSIPNGDVENCIPNWDSATFENELGNSPTENLYQNCDALYGTLATMEFINPNATTNTTWGSDNGFWGDTTPANIASEMVASVQQTGATIWPLFAFVGIAVAFGIAGLVVLFIKNSTTPTRLKKEVINPKGEELIYHNAKDLEFIREYGQPKRKRGRPRKNPI